VKLAVPSTAWAGFALAATGFARVVWLAPSTPLLLDGLPELALVPAAVPLPFVPAALSELFVELL
jgi:hypothetical protein